jgi:hypothetical protein
MSTRHHHGSVLAVAPQSQRVLIESNGSAEWRAYQGDLLPVFQHALVTNKVLLFQSTLLMSKRYGGTMMQQIVVEASTMERPRANVAADAVAAAEHIIERMTSFYNGGLDY